MQNMSRKKFKKLMKKNGFVAVRQNGSHMVFKREDDKDNLAVPYTKKEINGPLTKRELKKHGIKV